MSKFCEITTSLGNNAKGWRGISFGVRSDSHRWKLNAACTSSAVQLIRAMKQALVKQTAEALKQCQAAAAVDGKKSKAGRTSRDKSDDVDKTDAPKSAGGE